MRTTYVTENILNFQAYTLFDMEYFCIDKFPNK